MLIVDAHLDLAHNAARGRDPRQPASQQPQLGDEIATVGLPDLRAGGASVICATIFCAPASYKLYGYRTADEARVQALSQLGWYQSCIDAGLLRMVRSANDLPRDSGFQSVPEDLQVEKPAYGLNDRATNDPLGMILLLEGSDALRTPDDVKEWHDAGLRIVGMAWRQTRHAGGTGAPGPLTDEGRALVRELDRFGIIHDTSHLAEQSFWDLMDLTAGPVIASHSNCRAIVGGGDRHLSDDMIREIAGRGGVIGINFYDKFLLPLADHGKRRATLADVVNHMRHIANLTGSTRHIGIGTDMDGGLGRNQIPVEIETSADLPRVADALSAAGFPDDDIKAVMGANWLALFARVWKA